MITRLCKIIKLFFSVLEFHPDEQKQLLFAAGDDKHEIFGWDITTGQLTIRLKAHLSKVTSLSFHNNGINLVRYAFTITI